MVAIASGLDTVVVRVTRAPATLEEHPTGGSTGGDGSPRTYVALVYGRAVMPFTHPAEPPPGEPAEWAGEPLVGVERFAVDWRQYGAYLASFVEGGKQAGMMQERLFEAVPPGLSAVLDGEFGGARRTRTWFDSDAPELAELPWELLAYRSGRRASSGASFVRGLPPDAATPLVPITDGLRLGLVDPAGRAPRALTAAVDSLAGRIEVQQLAGGVRSALNQAAAEGLELLHLVADGSITSSLEALLEFPGANEAPLAASEMASILRGSRVRVVGLTPCAVDDQASSAIDTSLVPSAHRAFTYFATSIHPIPTTVAPLGPLSGRVLEWLWSTFYGALAETFEIEGSLTRVQAQEPVAVALFLRQLQVPTFRRVNPSERPAAEPSAVHADLAASRQALGEIQALKQKLGLTTASLDAYTERETARQSVLEAEVSGWVEGVDEA